MSPPLARAPPGGADGGPRGVAPPGYLRGLRAAPPATGLARRPARRRRDRAPRPSRQAAGDHRPLRRGPVRAPGHDRAAALFSLPLARSSLRIPRTTVAHPRDLGTHTIWIPRGQADV